MAPRAIKRMSIGFAGTRIGVALMTAVDEHSGLKFRSSHSEDGGDVKQPKRCGTCDKLLKSEDIVKEYVFEDGVTVAVDPTDFEYAAGERSSVLDVASIVPLGSIDPAMTDRSYYLVPDEQSGTVYASFAEALRQSGSAAMTKAAVGTAEHVFAIRPTAEGFLALQELRFEDEIRDPRQLGHVPQPDMDLTALFLRAFPRVAGEQDWLAAFTDDFSEKMYATLLLKRSGLLPGRTKTKEQAAMALSDVRRLVEDAVAGAEGKSEAV